MMGKTISKGQDFAEFLKSSGNDFENQLENYKALLL